MRPFHTVNSRSPYRSSELLLILNKDDFFPALELELTSHSSLRSPSNLNKVKFAFKYNNIVNKNILIYVYKNNHYFVFLIFMAG